ncbi:putative membrane protein YphA (DoxX/SURF4 family) [Streptomyces sp. V4I23]|uniref:DoxX family membrane protein n=1 Tax=Streptomyces sp. V4I23 TaxID=3042282 RepID=UPI0027894A74|nr:DoxX family membrane protein [Streptomyces sp. V4I23]MDQ1009960.1 putative membrane protein YphA (DoxX/SURF4 family) [Streptomyces sp. V4I23]
MSVDTRTPRSGFDDQPALSMVKVDCDPAQVIVNHASFRVRLAQSARPARGLADTARLASVGAGAARRRAPVVWSGRSAPGDSGATGLLQAVRNSTLEHDPYNSGVTQVMPRVDLGGDTVQYPAVTDARPLLPPMRQAVGAYDSYDSNSQGGRGGQDTSSRGTYGTDPYGTDPYGTDPYGHSTYDPAPYAEISPTAHAPASHRSAGDPTRHAYYPGRRLNLGVVLLPLRVFLGLISVYAGMGKLCDPVYFDGGHRGSLVKWLSSLHPWALAEPLRDFALAHPVGAGLTVAFLQVVVGVLTVLGLWQRVAAVLGALLSSVLILTVSWRTVPVYDAPDFIFLAAWSPLIIAGAPVYSVDGRLAGEAWRTLGPRSEIWDLRRRVLCRGGLVAAVVVGLTMLVGSMLGGAVRSTEIVTVPGPGQNPSNHLPGASLPQESSIERSSSSPRQDRPSPSASRSGAPTSTTSAPAEDTVRETVPADGAPSQTQGTGQQPPTGSQPAPPPTSAGPTSSGGTGSGGASGGTSGGTTGGSGGSGGSGSGAVIGGLLG